ncbi:MAG: hypothetical protein AB8B58_06745 [Roseobacter sp.]
MSTKLLTTAAIFGFLCFNVSGVAATADEILGEFGTMYGQIYWVEGRNIIFRQNCQGDGVPVSWDNVLEVRFSGDCGAAKSWRGGGDPSCESADGTQMWIEKPGLMSLEVMPEITDGSSLPYGVATEFLGRNKTSITYRDLCTGNSKTIQTEDLVLRPTDGYCPLTDCN